MGLNIPFLDLISMGWVLVETVGAEIGGDTLGTIAKVLSKTRKEAGLIEED